MPQLVPPESKFARGVYQAGLDPLPLASAVLVALHSLEQIFLRALLSALPKKNPPGGGLRLVLLFPEISLVEPRRIELPTFALRTRRSPS